MDVCLLWVLSCRGLCDELITRPEESYRLWCVVVCNLETSRMRRPWPTLGHSATRKKKGCEDPWLLFQKTVWKTLIYRGPNTTEHDFSIFYAVWEISVQFSLQSANMKYWTQNEDWISIRTTVCMYVCTCIYIYIYILCYLYISLHIMCNKNMIIIIDAVSSKCNRLPTPECCHLLQYFLQWQHRSHK